MTKDPADCKAAAEIEREEKVKEAIKKHEEEVKKIAGQVDLKEGNKSEEDKSRDVAAVVDEKAKEAEKKAIKDMKECEKKVIAVGGTQEQIKRCHTDKDKALGKDVEKIKSQREKVKEYCQRRYGKPDCASEKRVEEYCLSKYGSTTNCHAKINRRSRLVDYTTQKPQEMHVGTEVKYKEKEPTPAFEVKEREDVLSKIEQEEQPVFAFDEKAALKQIEQDNSQVDLGFRSAEGVERQLNFAGGKDDPLFIDPPEENNLPDGIVLGEAPKGFDPDSLPNNHIDGYKLTNYDEIPVDSSNTSITRGLNTEPDGKRVAVVADGSSGGAAGEKSVSAGNKTPQGTAKKDTQNGGLAGNNQNNGNSGQNNTGGKQQANNQPLGGGGGLNGGNNGAVNSALNNQGSSFNDLNTKIGSFESQGQSEGTASRSKTQTRKREKVLPQNNNSGELDTADSSEAVDRAQKASDGKASNRRLVASLSPDAARGFGGSPKSVTKSEKAGEEAAGLSAEEEANQKMNLGFWGGLKSGLKSLFSGKNRAQRDTAALYAAKRKKRKNVKTSDLASAKAVLNRRLREGQRFLGSRGLASTKTGITGSNMTIFKSMCLSYHNYQVNNDINMGQTWCPKK